ncbi:hypothetical protein JHK84_034298 [Glycine max]|nr:hypothetical protein JHK86_034037 [Glycine max]KAG5140530.1 hypothetical protein JHK84_034298 [Glycine max]
MRTLTSVTLISTRPMDQRSEVARNVEKQIPPEPYWAFFILEARLHGKTKADYVGNVPSYLEVLSILLLQCYPLMKMLSGFTLDIVINIASILKNVLIGLYRGSENNEMRLGVCSRSNEVVEPMIKPQPHYLRSKSGVSVHASHS